MKIAFLIVMSSAPSSFGVGPTTQSTQRSPNLGRLRFYSRNSLGSLKNLAALDDPSRTADYLPSQFTPLISPDVPGLHHVQSGRTFKNEQTTIDENVQRGLQVLSPPKWYQWLGPALLCALCYALYNIFIKLGSASVNPILGGVILQIVASLCGMLLLSVIVSQNPGGLSDIEWDWTGVRWAMWAGVAVGAAEIISFIVSGMGVQAIQSIPIVIGGSVVFGTILGMSLLKESMTSRGWLGVAFVAGGIVLVGTDPGVSE